MEKTCVWCGNTFICNHKNEKYCSEECRHAGHLQSMRDWRVTHNNTYKFINDESLNKICMNDYNLSDVPEIWRHREKETPGYAHVIGSLYRLTDFTCEVSGRSGTVIHHLNSYHWCEEGRCDRNNMVVLNKNIHNFFHFLYGYKDNTYEQFDEFLNIHFVTSLNNILSKRGSSLCN